MMKTVILAGGLGTRLSEETAARPKPMVEIGGLPILWHIMKMYGAAGLTEFVLALGYKGDVIESFLHDAAPGESWTIDAVDTGLHTQTGGRLKRLSSRLATGTFMLTYGDGVADLNLQNVLAFHRRHGRLATVTAVRPPARFGALELDGDMVSSFSEKPQVGEGWINGGFFVFEPGVLDYVTGDDTILERDPLERLAGDGQLAAFRHEGFWQCMDTLRDVRHLNALWAQGSAPWATWKPGVTTT